MNNEQFLLIDRSIEDKGPLSFTQRDLDDESEDVSMKDGSAMMMQAAHTDQVNCLSPGQQEDQHEQADNSLSRSPLSLPVPQSIGNHPVPSVNHGGLGLSETIPESSNTCVRTTPARGRYGSPLGHYETTTDKEVRFDMNTR